MPRRGKQRRPREARPELQAQQPSSPKVEKLQNLAARSVSGVEGMSVCLWSGSDRSKMQWKTGSDGLERTGEEDTTKSPAFSMLKRRALASVGDKA